MANLPPLQTFHEFIAANKVLESLVLKKQMIGLSDKDQRELSELKDRIYNYIADPTPPNTEQPPSGNADNPNHARSEHDYTHESVNQK